MIYRSLQLSIMVWALLRTVIAASLLAPAALQVQAGLRVEVRPTASLGVRIADVDQAAMKRLKLPQERGVLITAVEDNAPAKQAGLHADDVLWRFRGEDLYSVTQLRRLVHETPPGRSVHIDFYRAGVLKRATLVLAADESRQEFTLDVPGFRYSFPHDFSFEPFFERRGPRLGITVVALTGQLAAHLGAQGGLLVTAVEPEGPAERAGIKAGDVIERVDGHLIDNKADLREATAGKTMISVEIVRDRKRRKITVRFEAQPPGGSAV
ncbi:MAG: PDZ domain-containing protein [Acidiferrobacterales bacterium]|nr:PDZ domain-containing protein [Gammaproteobacteria bacterium]